MHELLPNGFESLNEHVSLFYIGLINHLPTTCQHLHKTSKRVPTDQVAIRHSRFFNRELVYIANQLYESFKLYRLKGSNTGGDIR